MNFEFDSRPSDSEFVEGIWRTRSDGGGSFISVAQNHWGMVLTRQKDRTWLTVRGPETRASIAPVPEDAEFFGIVFKLGTYMPVFPPGMLVGCGIDLPDAATRSFWLHGSAWEFPEYHNADTFLDRLARRGLLMRDPVVEAVLRDEPVDLSVRSVRRHFLQTTGLTPGAVRQIERAQAAAALLRQGRPILDTVFEAGYFDQPHLTRSLKRLLGQTPAEIIRQSRIA